MLEWLKENVVAAYAALVATIALVWNVFNARRDRAKIILSYQMNMRVSNSPIYEKDVDYLILIVTNRGRRPVVISTAGYKCFGGHGGIFTDSLILNKNKTLDERNPMVEFLIKQSLLDLKDVEYFFAKDMSQSTYKRYPHSFSWIRKLLIRSL